MAKPTEVYVIQPETRLTVAGASWRGQMLSTVRSSRTKYGEELEPGEVDEAFLIATCVVIDGRKPEPRVTIPLGATIEVPGLGRFRVDPPGFCGGDSCVLVPLVAKSRRSSASK